MGLARTLDLKLVTVVVTAVLVRLGLEVGVAGRTAPLKKSLIAIAAGAIAGWFTANDGTLLRTRQESGNPDERLVQEKLG
jgi:hypothetical protein